MASPARHSSPIAGLSCAAQHRDSVENTEATPWEWTPESLKKIDMYLKRYPDTPQGRQSAIMPLLWVAQQQTDEAHRTFEAKPAYEGQFAFSEPQGSGGWVPLSAMHAIADRLGMLQPCLGPRWGWGSRPLKLMLACAPKSRSWRRLERARV